MPTSTDEVGQPEPRRFFFVHLQKTAGTSLAIRLRRQFGEDAVYPTPDHGAGLQSSFSIEDLRRRFAEDRDHLRVVTGHFPLCAASVLGVPFSIFTVLRDPVERTLSYLRGQQARTPEFSNSTLEEIYEEPWRRAWLLTNHMVRQLGLTEAEMTAGTIAPDEENLERAKRNLTERLDLYGFQDRFEEFCAELDRRYGWDLGPEVRANWTAPADAPSALRKRIADDNEADVELYQYALDLRDRQLS